MRAKRLAALVAALLLAVSGTAFAASPSPAVPTSERATTVICPPAATAAIGQQAQSDAGSCQCSDVSGTGKCTVTMGLCNAGYAATCGGTPTNCTCSCRRA